MNLGQLSPALAELVDWSMYAPPHLAKLIRQVAADYRALLPEPKPHDRSKVPTGRYKRCPGCGREQDLCQFAVNRKRKDGRQYECRECRSVRYKQRHKDAVVA